MKRALVPILFLAFGGTAWSAGLTDAELKVLGEIARDKEKLADARKRLEIVRSPPAEKVERAAPAARSSTTKPVYADRFGDLVRKQEVAREPGVVAAKPTEFSPCAGFKFLLRQDWKDIGFLECPQSVDKATGAELAFANDIANHNRILSANGTAALVYSSLTSDPPLWWTPYYTSFATYVTANRTTNSSPAFASADVEKLAYGAALELGWETSGGANYFRIRGDQVENNLKGTMSATATAEFIPVYYPLYIHYPIIRPGGLPVDIRFDPKLLVQYAQITGTKGVLDFNGLTRALRIGPELSVYLFPEVDPTNLLSRMHANLTYHWAYETYSGKPIDWLQAAIIYNIDDAGHFALSTTYKRGRDEDTGSFAHVYRIGLTGKI
ncbi:MAG: hypothetical protein QHD01_02835 [Bradyrhizobium sp.]|uniref:hypothetical protein n=1 Tax=Bradyrhizobium sp. TaxID=376 RepID=UPI0029BABA0C|nr:hypothetical protein [Bradyrhizobium sp.]MDX3965520.1 hypothetical protein [Bradyrhizobium sp.]